MSKNDSNQVYLEPIEHVYIHKKTGVKFTSVTKVLSTVEPHFDAEGVSLAIFQQQDHLKQERYIGMSQVQILDFWQMLNDTANIYGTKVHDIIEKYLLSNKWYFPEDPFEQKVIDGYLNLKIDEGMAMHPERIMFSQEYELAGMSDLIIDINDVFFDLGDWKTNNIFNYYNPYGYETLHKPFDHLQSCQWSIYTIQLSVYALMYEMEFPTRKCRQIWVGYWDKETEVFSKIPIMYLKNEAMKLLQLHKFNTQYK